MTSLPTILAGSLYQGYTYGYPHKTAYRLLDPPIPLSELWSGERRDSLFLYLHVPFCEMRCGFCNLFTQAQPKGSLVAQYLDALRRQAERVRQVLGEVRFVRFAVGGGTPTQLDPAGLQTVLDVAEANMGVDLRANPSSIEASPETVTAEKLALLVERGVDRLSLGVQSFVEAEVHAVGRPQQTATVERALDLIRRADFPTLNIDLIYGLPGQTVATWLDSMRRALEYSPEELYLYPLYVRPLTGLGRSHLEWDDIRRRCYREGRQLLLEAGYQQLSMRMFRAPHAPSEAGPVYCCQEDGMVGLGCGARSYTRALHYSSEYAVGAAGIREIIAAFIARPEASFDVADYGYQLDDEEQRRRYIIQSLLSHEDLLLPAYARRFGSDALVDLPQLRELESQGFAVQANGILRLTEAGLEHSDVIGPWLYSEQVRRRMEGYAWRSNLSILYRGPLSSCNYGCWYCPFAKRRESAAELAGDRQSLERFTDWVAGRTKDRIGVLFTPWGEALIRPWYQQALSGLTRLPHVARAAIQTNLSSRLDWVEECDKTRLALWTTFHPTEVTRAQFVARCQELDRRGVRFSAGAVGLKENLTEIEALRRELPTHTYLWVNAYKREPDYYTEDDIQRLETIDPLFPINTQHHPSLGQSCRCGTSVISVDGDGTMRRCHFIRQPIGNLYELGFERALFDRPCPNATCGCHIGYVHLDYLRLYDVFGAGILERIPETVGSGE